MPSDAITPGQIGFERHFTLGNQVPAHGTDNNHAGQQPVDPRGVQRKFRLAVEQHGTQCRHEQESGWVLPNPQKPNADDPGQNHHHQTDGTGFHPPQQGFVVGVVEVVDVGQVFTGQPLSHKFWMISFRKCTQPMTQPRCIKTDSHDTCP